MNSCPLSDQMKAGTGERLVDASNSATMFLALLQRLEMRMAVLVDHVQELESAATSGGIELEVHGPHLVGMLGQ